jgi:hypothetical protein
VDSTLERGPGAAIVVADGELVWRNPLVRGTLDFPRSSSL